MVYIASDGKVYGQQPWSFARLLSLFLGFVAAIKYFFLSLLDPFTSAMSSSPGNSRADRSRGWGSGGGGGGGGSGGNDRRPPGPPRRPIGRINHTPSVSFPGGCTSCQG